MSVGIYKQEEIWNLTDRWDAVCQKYTETSNYSCDKHCPFDNTDFCMIDYHDYDDMFYMRLEKKLAEIEHYVPHGYWIKQYNAFDTRTGDFNCSVCDMPNDWKSDYCPWCGAKMDGGIKDAN